MNKDNLLTDLAKLLIVDKNLLNDSFNLNEELNWDSLSVVSTVAAIDQHYKVSMKGTELMSCRSIGDIFFQIEKKLQTINTH